jgi:hypothetical protein
LRVADAACKTSAMPNVPPTTFRSRYDALEQRRAELLARLEAMDEAPRANPAYGRARTLLNTTFRKAKLVQRAAILQAADWLIVVLDRSTTML